MRLPTASPSPWRIPTATRTRRRPAAPRSTGPFTIGLALRLAPLPFLDWEIRPPTLTRTHQPIVTTRARAVQHRFPGIQVSVEVAGPGRRRVTTPLRAGTLARRNRDCGTRAGRRPGAARRPGRAVGAPGAAPALRSAA